MTCGPGAHVVREQVLRDCLAAGREKEGELVTTPRCARPAGELARRLVHMLNVERITKIVACDAEKRFVTNVKCPTGWPHFGSNSIPHCKLQSNAQGMPAGGGGRAVLVLTGTLFRILESGFCVHFKTMKMDYESKESILKL